MTNSDLPPLAEHLAAAAAAPDQTPSPLRERLQQQLPEYQLLTTLGQGGMGAVFRAHHQRLDREVAVKVLLPNPETLAGWEERFLREARALAKLTHPGIVTVHDFGQADGLSWIVMEYVDGVNLRTLMEDGRLPPADALAIVPQVCAALQCAHDRGIVHRDVKPENILLDEAGQVRIVDFGLAKLMNGVNTRLSGTGQTMGTLRYMAPEQLERPGEVDHRADIFSLGVVFYELLTGRVPAGSVQPPSAEGCEDKRLDGMVMRSMEREPGARYQRAGDLQEELSELSQSGETHARPSADPTEMEDLRRRLRWACSGLSAVGLATLLGTWTERRIPLTVEQTLVQQFQPLTGYSTLSGVVACVLLLGIPLVHACLFTHNRGRTAAALQAALGLATGIAALTHYANDYGAYNYTVPFATAAIGGLILVLALGSCILRHPGEHSLQGQLRSAGQALKPLARTALSPLLGGRAWGTAVVFGLGVAAVLADWQEAFSWRKDATNGEAIALGFALLAGLGLVRFKSALDTRTGALLQGLGALGLAAYIYTTVPEYTDLRKLGILCALVGALLAFLRLRSSQKPSAALGRS